MAAVTPGARSRLRAAAAFARAWLGRVTWRAMLLTQGLGLMFALSSWLELLGDAEQTPLPYQVAKQAVSAALVMLAAFAADEAVRRGRPLFRTFLVTLLGVCAVIAPIRIALAVGFGIVRPGHLAADFLDTFLDVGGLWATALAVYLNRQRAARMLASVRAGELARLTVERRLLASRLATTGTEIDPDHVLLRLDAVRSAYAVGDPEADGALERLGQDLRRSVARAAAAVERLGTQGPEPDADTAGTEGAR